MAPGISSPILPFSCIGPKPHSDPMNIMWWIPDQKNFVPDNEVLHGIGKLEWSYFLQLQRLSVVFLERAEKPLFHGKVVPHELSKILLNLLHCLKSLSSSFFMMQHGVCDLQRTFLELKGFLDFEECYRLETGTLPVVLDLMGAFTWDPKLIPSGCTSLAYLPLFCPPVDLGLQTGASKDFYLWHCALTRTALPSTVGWVIR